jgi:tol-pal system protein YbgF
MNGTERVAAAIHQDDSGFIMKFRPIAGALGAFLLLTPAAFAADNNDASEVLRAFGQEFADGIRPVPKLREPGSRQQGMFVGSRHGQFVKAAATDRAPEPSEVLRAFGQEFADGIRPVPKIRVPGDRAQGMQVGSRPIQLAQAGDPRVVQLEEQIRQLNGLVEELNFQVLQMQDQLRRMQEDYEFRFQQLEGSGDGVAEPAAGTQQRGDAGALPPLDGGSQTAGAAERGEPARTLGQITFDANGNPIVTAPPAGAQGQGQQGTIQQGSVQQGALPGVETGPAVTPGAPAATGTDGTQVAALPSTDSPDELYRNAYEFMLSGDYATAEAGFREHTERFPGDPRAADAQFWLGESLLAQERSREAAQVFLAASRTYPQARKAPDMMLKLGVALVAMNQKDVACATLAEVGRRYPDASAQIKGRVKEEQQRAAC